MARTVIMDHPLIQHKIGIIRKKDTSSKEFREMISEDCNADVLRGNQRAAAHRR